MPEPVTLGLPVGHKIEIDGEDALRLAEEGVDASDDEEYLIGVLLDYILDDRSAEAAIREWAKETGHHVQIRGPVVEIGLEDTAEGSA